MLKKIFLLLIIGVFSVIPALAQVVINEIQSSNITSITDEDGEYHDWIELYNAGTSQVSLKDYGLTDNPSELFKWQFPDLVISPQDYLIVFASGKDRKTTANHWETAVNYNDTWKYFVGVSEPLSTWNTVAFNDAAWSSGPGGIGYGDGDDNTVIPNATSVYMRKKFFLTDITHISEAILSMDYDDGFVAYINGVEIARSNVSGTPPLYSDAATASHEAQIYQGGLPDNYTISKQALSSILVQGYNVLSIQVLNTGITSSDMSAIPWLTFGLDNSSTLLFGPPPSWLNLSQYNHTNFKLDGSGETIVLTDPSGNIINQKTYTYIAPDNSMGRNPDGSSNWCIFTNATPGQTNVSSVCNTGYISTPQFSLVPGFYPDTISLTISCSTIGAEIHYTRNGKIPIITDPIYTGTINIDTTTTIRAKAFNVAGFLPGKINTGTYFIDETANLPVITISTDSANLWDYNTGIYVMGPNADPNSPYFGANFWQDWQRESHVEYFLPMGSRQFDLDAGLSINGAWSRAFGQKSFQLESKSYDDPSVINYHLFPDKPIFSFKSFNLRNSGNDWLNTMFRDDLMAVSIAKTHVDYSDYQPVIVFLNTQYWGLYNMRERTNSDFLYANHGVSTDSNDVISNEGVVEEGTDVAFWQMNSFITANDISLTANYDSVKNIIDIENYVDYFASEIFYDNGDWIGDWTNNIKLWRPQRPGGKWRFIMKDMDFGLGLSGSYTDDRMDIAAHPNTDNVFSGMFRKMLTNADFNNYFINRFADLLNTTFYSDNLIRLTHTIRDRISSEMPRELLRWTGNPDIGSWYYNNIGVVTDFMKFRPAYARNQIQSFFNMNGQVDVTLDVFPAGAGKIKISTIVPDSLPWHGVYFNGNPVEITAIPNPGYTFQYWEPNTFFTQNNPNQSITLNISNDDTFRAHFSGSAEPLKLSISEVNYHSDPTRNAGDWIELHNYGTSPLDVSEWWVTDSVMYHKYVFPMGIVVPANGYYVLAEDSTMFHSQHQSIPVKGQLNFNLSNSNSAIVIYNNNDIAVKSMHYYDSIPWIKVVDGYGRTMELVNDTANPGRPSSWFAGCICGSPGGPYAACNDQIIFSEINYNSSLSADAGDWIELHNIGNGGVNISNWTFKDKNDLHSFIMPAGTVMLPHSYLVLCNDMIRFASLFPGVNNVLGPFNFGLSSTGDVPRLYSGDDKLYMSVAYDENMPWPQGANAGGYTLELIDSTGHFCDASSWMDGCPGGSPGKRFTSPCDMGIKETYNINGVSVYPNPASDKLFVECANLNRGNYRVQILQMMGTVVMEQQIQDEITSIDVSSLAKGVYILRVSSGKGVSVMKFVKE